MNLLKWAYWFCLLCLKIGLGRGETGIWKACMVGILVSAIRFLVSDFKPFG